MHTVLESLLPRPGPSPATLGNREPDTMLWEVNSKVGALAFKSQGQETDFPRTNSDPRCARDSVSM